jgi:hypothetical protein
MDNWVDNTKLPDLLIVDRIYKSIKQVIHLTFYKVAIGTIPGTTITSSQTNVNSTTVGRTTTETTTTTSQTYASLSQTSTLGYYDKLGSTYNNQNGYITDISILPYIELNNSYSKQKVC